MWNPYSLVQGENIFVVNFQETESYLWGSKGLSRNELYLQDNNTEVWNLNYMSTITIINTGLFFSDTKFCEKTTSCYKYIVPSTLNQHHVIQQYNCSI